MSDGTSGGVSGELGGATRPGPASRPAGTAQPTPAATVVPLRDGPAGLEVLMLRRNARGPFGGMWVFPGGQVDDADRFDQGGAGPAAGPVPEDAGAGRASGAAGAAGAAGASGASGPGSAEGSAAAGSAAAGAAGAAAAAEIEVARRAAVREAREEAGIELDLASLVVLSFWLPPPEAPRRFATWFFLAPADHGADIVIDRGEIREHRWIAPSAAMAARQSGDMDLAPPTFTTLWWLSRHRDSGEALTAAGGRAPERFETHVFGGADRRLGATLWEGDAGYEDGDLERPGPRRRLVLDPAGWRIEMSP